MKRSVALSLALAVALSTAGCGDDANTSSGPADCDHQVRLDGRTYTSHGYTDRDARQFGQAELAECHDFGPDAPGSVFPADPHHVPAWSFAGYSTDTVIGVRFDTKSFAVFVADDVSRQESDRIYRELGKASAPTS